jgi:hypothetical protein
MTNKLKAPSVYYAHSIYRKDDPKELFISVNEFAYHISSDSKNALQACYWLEWIMEFQKICASKKEKCVCERRSNMPVDDKFQMDPIWIIWELILNNSGNSVSADDKIKTKILNSILKLYCLKYTPGVKKRRRYLIYYAISILTEKYDTKVDIIKDKEIVETVVKKINAVYKQIKKNEIGPKVDYLMCDIKKSNIEKTIDTGAPYGAKGHALTLAAYPVIGDTSIMGGTFASKAPSKYKIYAIESINQAPVLCGELNAQ